MADRGFNFQRGALREAVRTPLQDWMDMHSVSNTEMAGRVGLTRVNMLRLVEGRGIPSLVTAVKVEQATGGDVPCESWLKTPLGKNAWTNRDRFIPKKYRPKK